MNPNKIFLVINRLLGRKTSLAGVSVWLSGAIPEKEHWIHPLIDYDIMEFVSVFSALIFKNGGTIVHGSHPLFTPILAEQAKKFASSKHQCNLFVSSLWGTADLNKYAEWATITEVKKFCGQVSDDGDLRNKSLNLLRHEMAKASNCTVSIGGKRHLETKFVPGVQEEYGMAKEYGIPCYNIGGFGGVAEDIHVDESDNPLLSRDEILYLKHSPEISFLPSKLITLMRRDYLAISTKK